MAPPKVIKVVPKQFDAGRLMAPKNIPKDVAMIKEEEVPVPGEELKEPEVVAKGKKLEEGEEGAEAPKKAEAPTRSATRGTMGK